MRRYDDRWEGRELPTFFYGGEEGRNEQEKKKGKRSLVPLEKRRRGGKGRYLSLPERRKKRRKEGLVEGEGTPFNYENFHCPKCSRKVPFIKGGKKRKGNWLWD